MDPWWIALIALVISLLYVLYKLLEPLFKRKDDDNNY